MMGEYTYTITNTTNTMYPVTTGTTSCTVWGCNCTGYHYWWQPYTTTDRYLYQIFCPRPGCKGKFWAEVGEIKPCPVCKSKIKITDEPPHDYEVEVSK